MTSAVRRYALALDLSDDPADIAAYEKAHEAIWPEVATHLRRHGVLEMEIYRLGTRLFMVMEVDPQRYNAEAMAQASRTDPVIARWEDTMGRYQRVTPFTAAGDKWAPMQRIFSLLAQKP